MSEGIGKLYAENVVSGKVRSENNVSGTAYVSGIPGKDGRDGIDGYTPVKGVDYFTDADLATIDSRTSEKILENSVSITSTQALTDQQKSTARTNIDSVSTQEMTDAITTNANKKLSIDGNQTLNADQKKFGRKNIGVARSGDSIDDWVQIENKVLDVDSIIELTGLDKYRYIHCMLKFPETVTTGYLKNMYSFNSSMSWNVDTTAVGATQIKSGATVQLVYESNGYSWSDMTSWYSTTPFIQAQVYRLPGDIGIIKSNGSTYKNLTGWRIYMSSYVTLAEDGVTKQYMLPAGTTLYIWGKLL